MRVIIVICALFFTQAAYCQYSKLKCTHTLHKPVVVQETCTPGNYCYWQRYCQAERGWYDTMEYPSYRRWPLLSRLSR